MRTEKEFAKRRAEDMLRKLEAKEGEIRAANNAKFYRKYEEAVSDLTDAAFAFDTATQRSEVEDAFKLFRYAVDHYNTILNLLQPGIDIKYEIEVVDVSSEDDTDSDATDVDEPVPRAPIAMESVVLVGRSSPTRKRKAGQVPNLYTDKPDENWTSKELQEYLRAKSVNPKGMHKHELVRRAQLEYNARK